MSTEELNPTLRGAAVPAGANWNPVVRLATGAFAALLLLMLGAAAGLAFYSLSHSNEIYEGVTVGGVDVGGMSRAEARTVLNEHYTTYLQQPLILTTPDESQFYTVDPSAVGIGIDIDATVDAAFAYGRDGSWWDRSASWAEAFVDGAEEPAAMTVNQQVLDATLATLAPELTFAPVNAYLSLTEGEEPVIVPELDGLGFDLSATTSAIAQHISTSSGEPVELSIVPVAADVSEDDLNAGLANAQQVVSAPLVVSGLDQNWGISANTLRQIIQLEEGMESVTVNEPAVRNFVVEIANDVDAEAEDATLTVDSAGKLAMVPSVDGVSVDVDQTTTAILDAIRNGEHAVQLAYIGNPAAVTDEEAQAAADAGEAMLDRGVTLKWDDGERTLDRAILLEALTFKVDPEKESPFTLDFDSSILSNYLGDVAAEIETAPVDALLRYVDGEIVVEQASVVGQQLDYEATLAAISNAALRGNGIANVELSTSNPLVTEAMAEGVTLEDVLAEASTFYGDSSDARRHNIERAVELVDGFLIAPGTEFSYARAIGPVTADEGFVTGFGIVDDPSGTGVTTAPVIGGGICQVSTTIFQASFWSGLPVIERYNHPYWIQAYGEPPRGMKGLDAMVNIEDSGSLDLRFTNSTGNWIVVQVVADGSVITARVLGTATGWNVAVDEPIITGVTEPNRETNYVESVELEPGTELQVEYAGEGFNTEIHRLVTDANGAVILEDQLYSSYAPSSNTILRGEGGEPTPEPGASPEPEAATPIP